MPALTAGNVAQIPNVTILSVKSMTCWRSERDSNRGYGRLTGGAVGGSAFPTWLQPWWRIWRFALQTLSERIRTHAFAIEPGLCVSFIECTASAPRIGIFRGSIWE